MKTHYYKRRAKRGAEKGIKTRDHARPILQGDCLAGIKHNQNCDMPDRAVYVWVKRRQRPTRYGSLRGFKFGRRRQGTIIFSGGLGPEIETIASRQ